VEDKIDRPNREAHSPDELYRVSDADIEFYIEECARQQCLAICEKMHEKLPRELRDMIYKYTIGIGRRRMNKSRDYQDVAGMTRKPWSKPDSCFGWMRDLEKAGVIHICNIDFVGLDTMRELAEIYYRTITFFFDDYRVDEMVAPFLVGV
jgi:hypothetical protein